MKRSMAGMTLVELSIVVTILGVVTASSVPRFGLAFERTRVDEAAATLRSIWHAQRMHWLEHHAYAPTLQTLVDERLLPHGLLTRSPPFEYQLRNVRETRFRVTARRLGSNAWSGRLEMDEAGEVSGFVRNGENKRVEPTGT